MSSTNRGGKRREGDFYPTPDWCVFLIARELDAQVGERLQWAEPCLGTGIIPRVLAAAGVAPPPEKWAWAEISKGRDYLEHGVTLSPEPDGPEAVDRKGRSQVDAVLTNPPFTVFQAFAERSLKQAAFVSYLMRITVLGSQDRRDWWQHRMPTHLFVMSQRPSFTGKGTDSVEYAWFTWDRIGLCRRAPGMYVL